jgi:HEAT repeat protein
MEAIDALIQLKDKSAIPAFIAALKDSNADVRCAAAYAFTVLECKDKSAIPALAEAAEDGDKEVRRYAVEALYSLSYQMDIATAVPALKKALRDKDSEIRFLAARILLELGDLSAVSILVENFRDDDADARLELLFLLSDFENLAIVPLLMEALEDSDKQIRVYAMEILSRFSYEIDIDNETKTKIIAKLKKALKDKEWEVRFAAARALGNIGDSSVIPDLKEVLLKEENKHVRKAVYEALKYIRMETRTKAIKNNTKF